MTSCPPFPTPSVQTTHAEAQDSTTTDSIAPRGIHILLRPSCHFHANRTRGRLGGKLQFCVVLTSGMNCERPCGVSNSVRGNGTNNDSRGEPTVGTSSWLAEVPVPYWRGANWVSRGVPADAESGLAVTVGTKCERRGVPASSAADETRSRCQCGLGTNCVRRGLWAGCHFSLGMNCESRGVPPVDASLLFASENSSRDGL
mmetsp:Transcript_94426/g.202713  ORF Transcript_94426/g.202713 Transcript_94426/m.202713 type:complete len:201 (+) Transcript_94426:193-795(+)